MNPHPTPPSPFVQRVTAVLIAWGELTRALEATLIDNLAATIPWLAPVVPAFMIYHSLTAVIHFPAWVGAVSAVVVEFLGLATVSTVFQFWSYNDARRKTDPVAPMRVAAGAAGFYLAVVILVNVILDRAPLEQLVAKALLSTLSSVAAITLSIRAQHARRLGEIAAEKAERKAERAERRLSGNLPAARGEIGELPETFRYVSGAGNTPKAAEKLADWRHLSPEEKDRIAAMTPIQVSRTYPVSDRTARAWVALARQNGYHHKEANHGQS